MDAVARHVAPQSLGDRIIKVNRADEHGAICIYAGQIHAARLTTPSMVGELIEFRSNRQGHRAIFGAELRRRGRPRCRSYFANASVVWSALSNRAVLREPPRYERK